MSIRYRVARCGEHVLTGWLEADHGDFADSVDICVRIAKETNHVLSGDIIYVGDRFIHVAAVGVFNVLHPGDPRVQGLYAKFVKVEQLQAEERVLGRPLVRNP